MTERGGYFQGKVHIEVDDQQFETGVGGGGAEKTWNNSLTPFYGLPLAKGSINVVPWARRWLSTGRHILVYENEIMKMTSRYSTRIILFALLSKLNAVNDIVTIMETLKIIK